MRWICGANFSAGAELPVRGSQHSTLNHQLSPMSLLSIFKARNARESRGDAASELFRRSAIKVFPLSGEDFAVYQNPGRPPAVLPSFVTDFLLDCAEFRPLAAHLETYAEYHGLSGENVGALQDWLPRLRDLGLLISAAELRARLSAGEPGKESRAVSPASQITAIGFLTCDRIALLRRGIESFIANTREHGRAPDFVVADDSTKAGAQDDCRRMLRAVAQENSVQIKYAGDEEKQRFAQTLTKLSGVAPALVDFALFGMDGFGYKGGANRNALMLHQAGSVFCTADDDAICRRARGVRALFF
jgi:hypothetical protein